MITVEEALKTIFDQAQDFGVEEIPLEEGMGRVLRETIVADRDFPPFNRVAMDGIAVRYDEFGQGRRKFPVEGVAAAGAEKQKLKDPGACLEVMTGAMMPEGADSIIRYEDISIEQGEATIHVDTISKGQNVHLQGTDRKQHETIIEKGVCLSSAEIGVCATVGKHRIKVSRLPKSLVLSSGDELVDINEEPKQHQIRKSNVHSFCATLKNYAVPVDASHLIDEYQEILRKLEHYLKHYDVIILSGGVSKGKFDFLPSALQELGVKQLFHKVKQRPGKPFWFGKHANGTTVFAFPGNPVSSFMCVLQYFKPWLEHSLGLTTQSKPLAVLAQQVRFLPDLTYFLQVKLRFEENGSISAHPVTGKGSGDLANLVEADGFLELPMGKTDFQKGEAYPFIAYRNLLGS